MRRSSRAPVLTPRSRGGIRNLANVVLHIHGDERPFLDVSSYARPVCNRFGQCTVSSGLLSNASGTDGLKIPPIGGLGTVWCLIAKIKVASATNARIFDARTSTVSGDGWGMFVAQSTGYPFMQVAGVDYGVGGGGLPAGNLAVGNDVLTEVAFSYDGAVLRCYVEGALSWTHAVALNLTSNLQLNIGNAASFNVGTTQAASELIIVKSEPVYTGAAYAVPARYRDSGIVLQGAEPVTFSNVKLLLHFEGSDGSTTFTDSSSNARTPTVVGNAQIDTAQFKFGSASGLFDGTGDRLSYANSADFNMGTADFGIEAFCRPSANSAGCWYSNYQNSSNGLSIFFNAAAGRMVGNVTGDGIDIRTQDGAFGTGAWKHNALTRLGDLLMIFVEIVATGFGGVAAGELVEFVTDTQNMTSTAATTIGGNTNVSDWNGHLDELRVVKAQAPYVRSYAVQTAAHPDA